MLKKLSLAICASLFVSLTPLSMPVAVADEQQTERKTRRVPAMNAKVYEQLARAQSISDEGDVPGAIAVLDRVKSKISSMNSYETAMMYNFYGFIHYNAEDLDKAIESFKLVVEQQPIPEAFEQTTLFSLAQLSMAQGNYDDTIEYLGRWENLQKGKIPIKNNVLKAQAMYQKKDYEQAIEYINQAIYDTENSEEGYQVNENWYILQRAIYYELKQPEKVAEVLEKMVKLFNEPKYWVQLGGMYGELGEEKKQLAVLEAAYQQGFVTSGSDIFNLAQLYYYHQVPYKGARLMEQAFADGVLERNLRNLKFLANCLSFAKEDEKAIPVLQAASQLSEDGELDAQLAQIFLNLERHDEAIEAASAALEKGGLRNEGMPHLVLGMSYFSKNRFVDALNALAEAEKFSSSKGMAQQWGRFVQSEKDSYEALREDLES